MSDRIEKKTKKHGITIPNYSLGEEIFNAISHGIGALLSVVALVLMLVKAKTQLAVVSVSIFGFALNGVNVDKYKIPSVICHLVCGWSILFGVPALLETMGRAGVYWLIGGGAAYTVGSILYGIGAKKKCIHCVFHVFCLIGTFCHFWAMYSYLL